MGLTKYIFEPGITLYRKTFKRSRIAHSTIYKIMQNAFVPLIEKSMSFYTLPDDPLWLRMDLLTGSYEKETVKLVNQLVKPGMTVLDIGAHVGYYTRLFAKLIGSTGQLIGFEPHPKHFSMLCNNVQSLKNVHLVQMAISNQEGTATLHDFSPESGGASLNYNEQKRDWYKKHHFTKEIYPRILKGLPVQSYTVKTTTVDSYLAGMGINKVDFIKMDIEGAEMTAIQGMVKTIRSSPRLTLVCEYCPQAMRPFGVHPERMLEKLKSLEFLIYIIGKEGLLGGDPMTQFPELATEYKRINLLALKGDGLK